jgi:GT2 family glycosyltransferase
LKLSIIIPTFQREFELERSLLFWQSELANIDYYILVANASDYHHLKVKFQSNTKVIFLNVPQNFWWSESVNYAINFSLEVNSNYVLITNDDMIYPKGITELFIKFKSVNEILTIPQLQSDGKIYFGSIIHGFFNDIVPYEIFNSNNDGIELTNGSCLFIPINVFKEIGLFNTDYLPHYYSDVEFFLRIKKHKIFLRLLNYDPIIQGPPTDFHQRFTIFNIFYHKGSPLNFRATFYFGLKLHKNYFNLFFGRGIKFVILYFISFMKFLIKKAFKMIID